MSMFGRERVVERGHVDEAGSERAALCRRLALLAREAAELFEALACCGAVPAGTHEAEGGIVEAVSESGGDSREVLDAFFRERHLEIVAIEATALPQGAWCSVARHIATTYRACKPFLDAIKRNQGNGRAIVLDLRNKSALSCAALTTLGALAKRHCLLPNYRYLRAPRSRIHCDPPVAPEAINFFTGGWLEMWAHAELMKEFGSEKGAVVARGVQFFLPDRTQFELDLIAVHPDGRALWVEAKTGREFASKLPKYRRIRGRLGLDRACALLLNSDSETESRIPADLAGMTPATIETFARRVSEALG